jgi:hypothetical protein
MTHEIDFMLFYRIYLRRRKHIAKVIIFQVRFLEGSESDRNKNEKSASLPCPFKYQPLLLSSHLFRVPTVLETHIRCSFHSG